MLLVFKVMLARAQTPHIFVLKSLIAVHLFNTPSDIFQSLYLLLSKALLALFSKTACKDTAFHACRRGKIDKKTAQFLA